TLLNPKVGLFYLAVVPQFTPHGGDTMGTSLILGIVVAVIAFAYLSMIAVVAFRAMRWLKRPKVSTAVERVSSGVIAGLGGGVVASGAPSYPPQQLGSQQPQIVVQLPFKVLGKVLCGGQCCHDLGTQHHVQQMIGDGGVPNGGGNLAGRAGCCRMCRDGVVPLVHGLAVQCRHLGVVECLLPKRDHDAGFVDPFLVQRQDFGAEGTQGGDAGQTRGHGGYALVGAVENVPES